MIAYNNDLSPMKYESLHLQINNYDSYQLPGLALDHIAPQAVQVPVIRVYGSLVFQHQHVKMSYPALIHIHNVYPYCYVSCDYEFIKGFSGEKLERHVMEITNHLEVSMAAAFRGRRDEKEDEDLGPTGTGTGTGTVPGPGGPGKRFIANIFLCKAVPIYGYRVGYKLYYKVNFLSPLYKSRFTNLFNDAKIDLSSFSGPKYKPEIFESHIPYISQFLTDYNLFSCNWLIFDNCYFRTPIVNHNHNLSTTAYLALKQYLTPHLNQNVLGMKFERMGKSILEFDLKSNQILNRRELVEKRSPIDFGQSHGATSAPGSGTMTGATGPSPLDVNLSSINLIVKELAYQSTSNGLQYKFDPSVMENDLWDKARTEWNNQLELSKLLSYSIKLTTPISDGNIPGYYNKFVKTFNERLDKFPTSFGVTDIEMFHRSSNLLVSDLYTYGDVDELFLEHSGSFVSSNGSQWVTQALLKDTSTVGASAGTSTNGTDTNINEADTNSGPELEPDPESQNESEDHPDVPPDPAIPLDPEPLDPEIEDSFDGMDSQFLQDLTQKTQKTNTTTSSEDLSKEAILSELDTLGIVKINYKDPYFDNIADLPPKPLVFANKRIKVLVDSPETLPYLPMEKGPGISEEIKKERNTLNELVTWEYMNPPPSKQDVLVSFNQEQARIQKAFKFKSQLELPVSKSNDFKFSINDSVNRRPDKFIQLTNMLMEIHVNTSHHHLLPNSSRDQVSIIFYKFIDANEMFRDTPKVGVLINRSSFESGDIELLQDMLPEVHLKILDNEFAVINTLLETVERFDPDILSGYEINSLSWGYLIERYRKMWNINLLQELSRAKLKNLGKFGDRWGYTHTTNFRIVGRFTLNIWRVLRRDSTLNNYSFENCCYHFYHHTFPKFLNYELTKFLSGTFSLKLFGLYHYLNKIQVEEFFINSQDLIGKNVEMSRLIGIDFNSNFYRGSQFKVESILSRLCKAENYLLNSPSKLQVHYMKPLQQIPLIMEPESNFYKSPLVVLDFQSLYPSIMIAYNYCYSTLLCRLSEFNPHKNPIGYLKHHQLLPMLIDFLHKNNGVTISPNGLVFVNTKFRKSMLAKMLQEILSVRINIKHFLKSAHQIQNPELFKVFDSRQLALKLIANVTYGYSSATFSGRMPNSDIADAIVATGREILTKSIDMIQLSGVGAKVVYGDTDSLFVYLPGKSREESFKIGETLANQVSSQFPNPVKLKFEKVYHPCVLLSKKRYVGNSYEFEGQTKPKFDAKGIETIRRDGIPAQQKIVEKALKILFETSNLSLVKRYVMTEFTKILENKVSIKDFCFAKEVRYGTYKNETYLPPGAIVARKKVGEDERSEPQYKERVPYVVYRDSTKLRLKDRCVSPEEFIESLNTESPKTLDYEYYITKVLIPPLERIFNLIGVDIKLWYKELPKMEKPAAKNPGTLMNFGSIKTEMCVNCHQRVDTKGQLCTHCIDNPHEVILQNNLQRKAVETKLKGVETICKTCVDSKATNSHTISSKCVNIECSNYFNKIKALNEYKFSSQKAETVFLSLNET